MPVSPLSKYSFKPPRAACSTRVSVLLGFAENDPGAISRFKAFRLGMRDLGWIEGRNVQIEVRFAGTNPESINKHVAELIRLAPDVIVGNSSPVMTALRPATSNIPIVMAVVNDPVGQGFISKSCAPGGQYHRVLFRRARNGW